MPINIPNLERSSELLKDLPTLWSHPRIADSQREALVKNVFTSIIIVGKSLISVEPKPEYAPLFASIVMAHNKVENQKFAFPPPPAQTTDSTPIPASAPVTKHAPLVLPLPIH